MNHADILKLLLPVELIGVHQEDADLEGETLDAALESAARLLSEVFPNLAFDLLTDWERVCAITPGAEDPVQMRRNVVLKKLREKGGLSRQYFLDLAAAYGWEITIDELQPFLSGVGRCGGRLYIESVRYIWRVNVPGHAVYRFRAGVSLAGERLTWWIPNALLEEILTDLKPAHTFMIFNYET